MPRLERKPTFALDLSIFLLVTAVFVADLLAPLGITVWVLYLVPLALCLLARRPAVPLAAAAIATLQLGVGFYLSPRESRELSWAGAEELLGSSLGFAMVFSFFQGGPWGGSLPRARSGGVPRRREAG